MRYLYLHAEKFEQTFLPFMVCCMSLFENVAIQVLSFYATFVWQGHDCIWAVMTYNGLLCISYINYLQYVAMEKSHEVKKKYEEVEMSLPCDHSIELADDLPSSDLLNLSLR